MSSIAIKQAVFDLFTFPSGGRGVWAVWIRNYLYFKITIHISLFWIVFEPVLYLFAIGYGLGGFVGQIEGMRYIDFFAPALMATTGMLVAFYEGTYGTYTKLATQRTLETTLLAPVSATEVALGEISWAASKGFFSVVAVAVVAALLGLVNTWLVFPALVGIGVLCWAFAAFGVLMSAYARDYNYFIYAQSGFIIPMSLFSGTYFPLNELPQGLYEFAFILPLTHSVMATRTLMSGQVTSTIFLNYAVLFFMTVLITNWAVARLRRRLIY